MAEVEAASGLDRSGLTRSALLQRRKEAFVSSHANRFDLLSDVKKSRLREKLNRLTSWAPAGPSGTIGIVVGTSSTSTMASKYAAAAATAAGGGGEEASSFPFTLTTTKRRRPELALKPNSIPHPAVTDHVRLKDYPVYPYQIPSALDSFDMPLYSSFSPSKAFRPRPLPGGSHSASYSHSMSGGGSAHTRSNAAHSRPASPPGGGSRQSPSRPISALARQHTSNPTADLASFAHVGHSAPAHARAPYAVLSPPPPNTTSGTIPSKGGARGGMAGTFVDLADLTASSSGGTNPADPPGIWPFPNAQSPAISVRLAHSHKRRVPTATALGDSFTPYGLMATKQQAT